MAIGDFITVNIDLTVSPYSHHDITRFMLREVDHGTWVNAFPDPR